jgi:hypothetical protein
MNGVLVFVGGICALFVSACLVLTLRSIQQHMERMGRMVETAHQSRSEADAFHSEQIVELVRLFTAKPDTPAPDSTPMSSSLIDNDNDAPLDLAYYPDPTDDWNVGVGGGNPYTPNPDLQRMAEQVEAEDE